MKKKIQKGIAVLAVMALCSACSKGSDSYEKGMELAETGKYEQALPYLEEAIQENAEHTEYYISYGMVLNKVARYEEAKEQFEKGIQDTDNRISEENNKQIHYGIAISAYGLGEYEVCVEHCENALKIEYFDQMDKDIMYTKALGQCLGGKSTEAMETLEQLLEKNKGYKEAYYLLAKLQEMTGDVEKAFGTYSKLLKQDEKNYDGFFGLYELYHQNGQEEEAEKILDELVVIPSQKAKNMLVIGRAYFYKGDMARARQYIQMAASANYKEGNYYLGILEKTECSFEKATEYFLKYVQEDGTNEEVYSRIAECYMETGDYEKAREWLQKGLAIGNNSAVMELKRNEIILCEKENNYKEAKKLAKAYIQCYPFDVAMQKELEFMKTR